jgi:hypothetical protein
VSAQKNNFSTVQQLVRNIISVKLDTVVKKFLSLAERENLFLVFSRNWAGTVRKS